MPGIFGQAGSAIAEIADPFDAMARLLKHESWYQESRHVDEAEGVALGRMALGFVDPAPQPASNEDDTLLAVLDGEIHDYDAQRRTLVGRGHVFRTDSYAELLVHGYEEQGQDFFRGLHGKFIAAIWDSILRRLILTNDRFGMRPLYYAHAAGRLVFAAEIKAVLADPAVSRNRSLRGIAQFFTYGQLLGDDTLLEAVRLLPAAGWLTYDVGEDRVQLDRYWKLAASEGGNPREGGKPSESALLERIDDAFGTAVQRSMAGRVKLGLSLSGGLDARTILGVADDNIPLTTVCIGMDGSMDQRSAAEMARLTQRPHHQCILGGGFLARFEEHLRHMVRLTDGHYLSQCIVMPTLPVYRNLGIQCLLRGHAGELMHMTKAYSFSLDGEALALQDEGGLENWLYRHLQTYMLEGTDGKLFAAAHRRQMNELARESLQCCLQESAGDGGAGPANRPAIPQPTVPARTAMSLVKFGSLVETRLPYLDNELVDALFAAPPEMKLDEKIQAHILRRHRPAFLNVTNVNTGARMGAGRLGQLVGKVRHKVFAKLGVRGYQPYERLGLWLRRELRPLVQDLLLNDRCLGRGLFDPQTVRAVVQNHFNGRNHTFLILAMMTYEMGQREFVDGDHRVSNAASHLPSEAVAS